MNKLDKFLQENYKITLTESELDKIVKASKKDFAHQKIRNRLFNLSNFFLSDKAISAIINIIKTNKNK